MFSVILVRWHHQQCQPFIFKRNKSQQKINVKLLVSWISLNRNFKPHSSLSGDISRLLLEKPLHRSCDEIRIAVSGVNLLNYTSTSRDNVSRLEDEEKRTPALSVSVPINVQVISVNATIRGRH